MQTILGFHFIVSSFEQVSTLNGFETFKGTHLGLEIDSMPHVAMHNVNSMHLAEPRLGHYVTC